MHEDKSALSLGQIICHVFEKSLNVQFTEFKGRLAHSQKKFFMRAIDAGDMQYAASFLWTDMKLSKFWMDLPKDRKDKLWARATEEEESIVETVRDTELYRSQQCNLELVKEMRDETEDEHAGTMAPRLQGEYERLRNSSSEDAASHERRWDANNRKRVMGVDKLKQRRYLQDEDSADEDGDLFAQRYNEGYQPLGQDNAILQPPRRGIRALDDEANPVPAKKNRMAFDRLDGDRTDTDNSIDKPRSQQRFTSDAPGKRGVVFQKHREQPEVSEGSNYEDDEFEEQSKDQDMDDDDMSDDFNLPKAHQ